MLPTVDTSTLGEYLTQLRASSGLSLREVRKRSGNLLSLNMLSRMERGLSRRPSVSALSLLAAVYGVPVEEMLRRVGYGPTTSAPVRVAEEPAFGTVVLAGLSEAELAKVAEFVGYLRWRSRKVAGS